MLKYLVARLLDTSKNTYYFLFILTNKIVLHRNLKTLLAKNNIVLSASPCRDMIWHAAACLENLVFAQPWHTAAWIGHAAACQPQVFWLEGLMPRHDKTMSRHALVTCPILLFLTPFCSNMLVLWSFYSNITYKMKTHIKMPKTGDKQYKTLSIYG